MRAVSCRAWGRGREPHAGDGRPARPRRPPGGDRRQGDRGQLRGRPHGGRAVPDTAALPLQPGPGNGWRRRPLRRRGDALPAGGPGDGHPAPRRIRRTGRRRGGRDLPDACRHVLRGGRRFPVAYISSHVAIRWQGRLEADETLLVLGAGGGVGLTAVEIGKAMGARVIAAASTTEKLAAAEEHGADALVNYATEPLTDRVLALTDGKGADVCFDPVGGDLFGSALSSLGWGGRILLVGFVGGIPSIPANRLLVKNRAALGSLTALLSLARARQAPALGRDADRVVRGGPAAAARHPSSAARARRGSHPDAHGPQGARQGGGRAGALRDRGL